MLRSACLLPFVLFIAACGGADPHSEPDAGPPGADAEVALPDATPSAVETEMAPGVGFLGQAVDVTITADFGPGTPTIDLGPGVTIDGAIVVEGTRATLRLQVAADAPLGERDLTIVSGGRTLSLAGAFSVSPSLAVTTKGTTTQGSVIGIELESLDPKETLGVSPFVVADELLLVPDFEAPFGHTAVLVAPGIATGPLQLAWRAPFDEGPPPLSATDALVIGAREPELLAPGTLTIPELAPFEDRFYRVHAPATSIVTLVSSSPEFRGPTSWIFEAGGRAADLLRRETALGSFEHDPRSWLELPSTEGAEYLAVVHGNDPRRTATDNRVLLRVTPATRVDQDGAAHATLAQAQATSGCVDACVLHGTIAPGARQVFVVPEPRTGGGFFIGAIRADSSEVSFMGDSVFPTGRFAINDLQRVSGPVFMGDANFSDAFYVVVASTASEPEEYSISIRWAPATPGNLPQP